jgi:hypothetical protein
MKLINRLILASLIIFTCAFGVPGQTPAPSPGQQPAPVEPARPSANEAFELNIDERRFSHENFSASTSVGTEEGSQGLNLQIGVALAAGRIDVLLRNVRGNVRFRGTLDRVLEILKNRRTPAP